MTSHGSLFGKATHTRQQIANAVTPAAHNQSYVPVPFDHFIDTTQRVLQDHNLVIANESYQLVKPMRNDRGEKIPNGYNHMFGVMELANMNDARDEVGFAVGIRSSHDGTLANCLCAGSKVFVCSNLCFSAEYTDQRRHTTNVLTDLPGMIDGIVRQFPEAKLAQEQLFERMRDITLTEKQALWLVYKAYKAKALVARDIAPIMDEVISERNFEQHANVNSQNERVDAITAWRLYNAGTQVAKAIQEKNAITASSRALAWHRMFNGVTDTNVESA